MAALRFSREVSKFFHQPVISKETLYPEADIQGCSTENLHKFSENLRGNILKGVVLVFLLLTLNIFHTLY